MSSNSQFRHKVEAASLEHPPFLRNRSSLEAIEWQGRHGTISLSNPAVTVRGLGKRYQVPGLADFWALQDVSFEVQCGEIVGILGTNGAGKSTLLKILSRVTSPSTGSAEVRGRLGSLLQVGAGFHHELSGQENIFLNGAILGMSKADIQRKFIEIVDFAEIKNFLHLPLKHYSSGMAARLAFAIAVHLEPEVLIVDEALSVGDASFQAKSQQKMREVIRQGRTVLLVSHNPSILPDLCTRALLLSRGRLIKEGSLDIVQDFYTRLPIGKEPESERLQPEGAPQPEAVDLQEILLSESIHDDEPIPITANCRVQRRITVRPRVSLFAEGGEPVLVSGGEFTTLESGNYRIRCEIPPDLLWPLPYSMELCLETSHGKAWATRRNFTVHPRSPYTRGIPHAWVRVPMLWTNSAALESVGKVAIDVTKATQA